MLPSTHCIIRIRHPFPRGVWVAMMWQHQHWCWFRFQIPFQSIRPCTNVQTQFHRLSLSHTWNTSLSIPLFFFFLNCLYLKRLFECIRNSLLPHHTWNIQNTLNNCSPSHLRIVMISSTRPMSDLTRPEWCMQFVICFDLYTTSHSHSICHTHVKISSPHFYIISFSAHS